MLIFLRSLKFMLPEAFKAEFAPALLTSACAIWAGVKF